MSLVELLPAIRALPREEKLELARLFNDEVAAPTVVDDGITDEMRKLLPPPGTVAEIGWQVSTDARGMEAIERVYADLKGAKE